eukprot:749015-Hanusia_phi.AAC.7
MIAVVFSSQICTLSRSCCQLACTCVWKAAGDGGVCGNSLQKVLLALAFLTSFKVQGLVDRKPMHPQLLLSRLIDVSPSTPCRNAITYLPPRYIFRRFVRISKAKKERWSRPVLAVWQHNQTSPDAPALPEEQIVPFSNLQAVSGDVVQ